MSALAMIVAAMFVAENHGVGLERDAASAPPKNAFSVSHSRFPLVYPVSDATRSVIRSVREQIGLTTQQMQALGCDYETSMLLLGVLRDTVEPLRDEIDELRRQYAAARSDYLGVESTIVSLKARLNGSSGVRLSDELRGTLEAELAECERRVESTRRQYAEITTEYEQVLAPITEMAATVLTPDQRLQWEASRRNASEGLPMAVWFVPGLSDSQRRELKQRGSVAAVLNREQAQIAQESGESYRSCADEVHRAEMQVFFGLEAQPATASVPPAAAPKPAATGCPYHK